MSYKSEVITDSTRTWCGNSLRFATFEDAADYAADLKRRWILVIDTRVVKSDDPVNYYWINGKLVPIGAGS